MKVIEQSVEILTPVNVQDLQFITKVGYVSHGTHKEPSEEMAMKFVKQHCIDAKPEHGTLLEFVDVTVRIITDRAIANELVRHRIATYNQRSSRYVKETDMEVIAPIDLSNVAYHKWFTACQMAETIYCNLIYNGVKPEEARDILPLCTATEIVAKMNLRSWRNFFKLRHHRLAHPKMQQLADMLLKEFKTMIPVVFDDID